MQLPTTREGLAEVLGPLRRDLLHTHTLNYLRATGLGEDAYVALLHRLAWAGTPKPSRSGGWTLGLVGEQFRCNLRVGFPILSGKKIYWKGVVAELLWFLNGETNAGVLQAQGVNIWNEWAKPDGELGPIYGAQWRGSAAPNKANRRFETDQLTKLLEGLEQDPFGRRHIVSAWNPDAIADMQLPPCHSFWQVVCHPDGVTGLTAVNLVLTQRSADVFLGVPFNIASYALLTHLLVAHLNRQRRDYVVGELVINFGDLHIYADHLGGPVEQYVRQFAALPRAIRVSLELPAHTPAKPWGWYEGALTRALVGYSPADPVKAKVAV